MKLCRFDDDRIGLVRGCGVHDVSDILDALPPLRYPVPFGDQLIAHLERLRHRMERLADDAAPQPVDEVRFLSPVANPSKIIGTPVNYLAHVEEARRDPQISVFHGDKPRSIEEQGLFLKASSSLVGPSEGVAIRFADRRTDHEAELGVVIGRKTGPIAEADALTVVAGAKVTGEIVEQGRGEKLVVFKFRRRKNYVRKNVLEPMGIGSSSLNKSQQELLLTLLKEYVLRYRSEIGEADLKEIQGAGVRRPAVAIIQSHSFALSSVGTRYGHPCGTNVAHPH